MNLAVKGRECFLVDCLELSLIERVQEPGQAHPAQPVSINKGSPGAHQENNNIQGTAPKMNTTETLYPGLTSPPSSIAFLSNIEYMIAFGAGIFSATLSFLGSATIVVLMVRRKKLNELSNRLIFGISALDLVVCVDLFSQPFMMRKDSGLPFAAGNARTCAAVGFIFNYFVGCMVYSCFLSIYFLLCVRYNKKEKQLEKMLEPYVHVIAIGVPTCLGIGGMFAENFNPLLSMGICDVAGVYPPACGFRNDMECERGGTFASNVILYINSVLPILLSIVGGACTWLVYWTTRQQFQTNKRYVISPGASASEALSPQQRKLLRVVSIQAILYFLVFFIGFVLVLLASVLNEVLSKGIQDVSELSGNPILFVSIVLSYFLFPLNGFLNMIAWMRPRIVRWKDMYPERGWLWAYRQVLSGRPMPNVRHICEQPSTEQFSTSPPRWWTNISDKQLKGPCPPDEEQCPVDEEQCPPDQYINYASDKQIQGPCPPDEEQVPPDEEHGPTFEEIN